MDTSFFDEEFYLLANTDVAKAVRRGEWKSGLVHYIHAGRKEKRIALLDFDEKLYLRRYVDVARGMRAGKVVSGLDHFLDFGLDEGREWQPPDPTAQQIMTKCCSLGDNCEFGVVQALYDAHPFDLFRWASISTPQLERLLGDRLEQVGVSQHFTAKPNVDGEWDILDRHYGVDWHTFSSVDEFTEEAVIKRESVRMAWLAKKLLSDLTAGVRPFVRVGPRDKPEDGTTILQLIQSFNPKNKLLWVVQADADNPAGSVRRIDDGFVVGYLPEFWKMNTLRAMWLRLVRNGSAHFV
jgi:hypothetical protein